MIFFTHPIFLRHWPGPSHPEQPSRLEVVLDVLRGPKFCSATWREGQPASLDLLQRVHSIEYLEKIQSLVPKSGLWNLDPDTVVCSQSWDAAIHAAGATCAAVDAVCTGSTDLAFCAVRPPGHHAESSHAIGFCLINNLAVAASYARDRHKIERIAIIDFDGHHGNGCQNIYWSCNRTLVASLHEWPSDLRTGDADEIGKFGQVINFPLPRGSTGSLFRSIFEAYLLPRLCEFRPELIFVAAGFDGHRLDPLTGLMLETEDFSWLGTTLRSVAKAICGGKVIASLEGGYNHSSLRASLNAFVSSLMALGGDENA